MDSAPPPQLRLGRVPAASYVLQRQDHIDEDNTKTWSQAFYVNDTFWVPQSEAPIFLCIGGEGPSLDGSAVVASVHCNVAVEWLQEKSALMFALEHRYYGCHNMSACPVSNLSGTSALRFLSSHQAIQDVAIFIRAMNTRYGLTEKNRWVTWGGSYPGMVAGWARIAHPELIHAAVASSAPVFAKYDMPEYLNHVSEAYTVSDNGVGGSAACQTAIRDGHAWIEERFQTGATGSAEVEVKFGLQPGSLASSSQRAAFGAFGVADFPAQSNDPLCAAPSCNIAKVCAVMTNPSSGALPVDRLLQVRKEQGMSPIATRSRGLGRASHSWLQAKLQKRVSGTDLPDFWLYQTCTEFGFYQTCETNSSCMFVQGLQSADDMAASCAQWGISTTQVMEAIDTTNFHYGGLKPSFSNELGTCVLWPNGEVDPWSTLSVLQPPGVLQPTLFVPGASHHSWTWPSRAGDQVSVIDARLKIRQQVEDFLSDDHCSHERDKPDDAASYLAVWITCSVLIAASGLIGLGLYIKRRRESRNLAGNWPTPAENLHVSLQARGSHV